MRASGYTKAMNLSFERGDADRPCGHAVVYFTTGAPERVLATYLVIPPIALNIAKYMPPMFAANLPLTGDETPRPMPLPPVPEEVPGRSYVQRLAELRGDDLVYAGSVLDDDPQRLLLETGYVCEAYGQRYEGSVGTSLEELSQQATSPLPELDPAALVYEAMDEGQRLAELTKLTGTLRDATERGDLRGTNEAVREMRLLVDTLPAKYRGVQILTAAQELGERGRRRCELLIQRAYALFHEEYLDVGRLDSAIEALDAPPAT